MIPFSPRECAQAAVRLHSVNPNFTIFSLDIGRYKYIKLRENFH